ncbi:MAG: TolC family protein [Pseudomonadota bacterium]
MLRPEIVFALLICCGLCGCATSSLDMAPTRPDKPWTPTTQANGEIVPGAKPQPATANASYVLPSNAELSEPPPPLLLRQDKAYSLAELIDISESNNPATRTAWNAARNVALAEGIAESTYLPRLSASVITGYQTSNGQNTAAGFNLGQAEENAHGTIAVVSLEWLLFDFGERDAIVEAAKQASIISNVAFTAAHQQVIYDVSVAFYQNAAARERLETARESLRNAQNVQAAAESRYKHGVGTVVETAQARQATAQAQLVLVQSSGASNDAYLKLISAMGISPLTKINVASVAGRRLSTPMYGSVEQFIHTALARRPDVLSAFAAQKASEANIRAAEAEFLPKFFVTGNGAYNNGNLDVTAVPAVGQQLPTVNLTNNQLNATVLGGVTFPLYDGGTRLAALKQAQANADNANLALLRTRDEAVRQIVLADNALHTSLAAYSASVQLTAAAQTSFDAALAAYRNGVGSITDATLAETQLLQARNARSDAYSTALSAAATLALAAGALGSAPP